MLYPHRIGRWVLYPHCLVLGVVQTVRIHACGRDEIYLSSPSSSTPIARIRPRRSLGVVLVVVINVVTFYIITMYWISGHLG